MSRYLQLIFMISAALLAGCGSVPDKKPYDGPLSWPQPPDRPRFAYEAILRSAANIALVSDEANQRELLTGMQAVSTAPAFQKPAAIVARKGRIYVADIGENNIVVFDIPRRKIFRMGMRDPGRLSNPAGIALDVDMNVYVVDSDLLSVFVYDNFGLFTRKIGGKGILERPTGVAVSPDAQRIYVVDRSFNESNQHRVVVFDWWGQVVQVIGTRGSGEGEFNVPLQATVGADGKLYILDSGNFRVQIFDQDGKFLNTFGAVGREFGNFSRPRGIAVDDNGNIYVSDAGFNNIQIFNPKGELLMSIGQGGEEPHPGVYSMVSGVAVDETGRIYLVDQVFGKIEVFRPVSESEGLQMVQEYEKNKLQPTEPPDVGSRK